MELDLSLVKVALSKENAFNEIRQSGITASMFRTDDARSAWKFVVNHYISNMELPSVDLLEAKLGLALPDTSDGVKTLIAEMRDRELYEQTKLLHAKLTSIIEAPHERVKDILPAIGEFTEEVHKTSLSGSKIGSLLALGPEVIEFYNRMKAGEKGIMSPWPTMNEATLGWWPGDFVVFVARSSVGKTFCLLMLAHQAWIDGKKVLFVGTEMKRLNLAMRFFAIHFRIPYRQFRRGQLGFPSEDKILESIRMVSGDSGINVVGDDFDADINIIISAMEQTRPDIVFVDGLYLVKNKGHDRHTRVSNTADDLKRAAKKLDIPIITSTQFNREASGSSAVDISADKVAQSDAILWNADVMYALFRSEDMDDDHQIGVKPLKVREGEAKKFYLNWNFETMDFSEVSSTPVQPDGDLGNVSTVGDDGGGEDSVLF